MMLGPTNTFQNTARAHERLSPGTGLTDEDLSDIVEGTRVDLSVWLRCGETSTTHTSYESLTGL